MGKIQPSEVRKFCVYCICITRSKNIYIFFILQHFETNLCNFTLFEMLFLGVLLDFVLLVLIKIQSIAGITHCHQSFTCDPWSLSDNSPNRVDLLNFSLSSYSNYAIPKISRCVEIQGASSCVLNLHTATYSSQYKKTTFSKTPLIAR